MAGSTQPRGAEDTSPRRADRTLGSRARRRLRIALVAATLLHVPFTPLASFVPWLARWFEPSAKDWDYPDGDAVIPIELDDEPAAASAPTTPEPVAAAPSDAPKPVASAAPPKPRSIRDAGVSDGTAGRDAALDAPAPDAGSDAPLDAPADAEAPLALADAGAGSAPSVKDTLGLAGSLTKTVKGKPNVVLVLWFSPMREHPLGRALDDILRCNPQWREFLGDDVDPLRDLDGVMLSGPQFVNSSKVTVAVQHHLPLGKVKGMIGGLVARSADAGAWMDGAAEGELVARAYADRADRVVFTHPKNMVFIAPPEGWEQIRAVKQPVSLPAGDGRSMSLTLATPWRPLRALKIDAPETLREMRLDVVATDDGGANLSIEFDDADAETARADADRMTEELARSAAAPFVGAQRFEASGARFGASAHLSRLKSALFLGLVRAVSCPAGADAGAR